MEYFIINAAVRFFINKKEIMIKSLFREGFDDGKHGKSHIFNFHHIQTPVLKNSAPLNNYENSTDLKIDGKITKTSS